MVDYKRLGERIAQRENRKSYRRKNWQSLPTLLLPTFPILNEVK